MSKSLQFTFEIKDRKVIIDKELFNEYMSKQDDGKYLMEIKKFYKKRSKAQNRWYWKIMDIIGEELGYTKDEMHDTFKATFLSDRDELGLTRVRSTTNTTTNEMREYIEHILRIASQQGITIPDPSSYGFKIQDFTF
jgi:hypothetical protein